MQNGHFSEDGWMLAEGIGSILFYLIMIGVVSSILYFLFSSSKLTQMQQALTTMSMQIQGLYSGASSYAGLDNSVAIKAGVVPRKLLNGNSIQTPWGGSITVAPGSNNGTFLIQLDGVEQEDCTKLGTYQMDMWEQIEINGASFTGDSGVSAAASSCTDDNSITYMSR